MKRFSKFSRSWFWLAAIWMIVLLAPPLRFLCGRQILGLTSEAFSVLPRIALGPQFWQDAARKFPDDPRIGAQAAEGGSTSFGMGNPYQERGEKMLRAYDALIEKFPHNSWLLARRLRLTITHFRLVRAGGELSDAHGMENLKAGKPSPERRVDVEANYNARDLERALELCKRGQKLEPKNAFWNWMLVNFYLMSWRDTAAWKELDAAGSKPHYNAHELEDVQAAVAARELALGRKLLWEEKTELAFGDLFGTYARWREMARIISWEGIKARRRGEDAKALKLCGNLACVAKKMREGSSSYIGGLVANAVEAIAYGFAGYKSRANYYFSPGAPRISLIQRERAFIALAEKCGREDLAREAAGAVKRRYAYQNFVRSQINGASNNLLDRKMSFSLLLWTAGVLLLLMLCGALFSSIICALPGRIPRVRSVLRLEENQSVAAHEVFKGILAWLGVRALWSTLITAVLIAPTAIMVLQASGQWEQARGFWFSIRDVSWLDDLSLMSWLANTDNYAARLVAVVSPIALGVLFTLRCALVWQKRQNSESEFSFAHWMLEVCTARAWRTGFDFAGFDFSAGARQILDEFLYAGFFACLIAVAVWPHFADQNWGPISVPLSCAVLMGGALVLGVLARWKSRPHKRAALRFGFRLFRASAWGFLVAASTLYLALLIASLPLRNHVEHRFDLLIQAGELRAARMK